ncbi:hypothetical protein GCM10009116_15780 [Brevundimonas basaltis]|uniref:Uncharacterized protein n=1 Tax=Brevundimonas basaltis TaxID=472166 RepID=A0A7W8HWJ9_9CAUL|nr:hypothetical protein [Brevundimonas basaltis]
MKRSDQSAVCRDSDTGPGDRTCRLTASSGSAGVRGLELFSHAKVAFNLRNHRTGVFGQRRRFVVVGQAAVESQGLAAGRDLLVEENSVEAAAPAARRLLIRPWRRSSSPAGGVIGGFMVPMMALNLLEASM